MNSENAAMIAIDSLGQLASDPEKISGFLALSGIAPDNLRAAARSPAFLQAVLEFICGEEILLREIAAATGRSPEDIDRARMVLAGPAPDWGA